MVHRLVAQAFIENPNNNPEVDHHNRNRLDNRASNLHWVTASENSKNRDPYSLNRKAKGTPIVEKINDEVSIGYLSMNSINGVGAGTLSKHVTKGETHFFAKGREFYTDPKV